MKSKYFVCLATLCMLIVSSGLSGCTASERARDYSLGNAWKSYHVKLYAANGSIIEEWDTKDIPQSESNSDGWSFVSKADGKIHMVSGTTDIYPNQ